MSDNYKEVINENEEDIAVVDLKNENGDVFKFYHIGTIEHNKRWFAFFQPAQEIDGLNDEEVVIFEIVGDDGDEQLAPVEDESLLDEVFQAFVAEMDEEDDYEEECDCGCHSGCDCDCDDDCDCDCDDDCDCGCGHHHHKDENDD